MKMRFLTWILLAALCIFPLLSSCSSRTETQEQTQKDSETKEGPGAESETGTEKESETEMDEQNLPIEWEALRQTGKTAQRWLSVPGSRLVLNPFNFNVPQTTTEADYSDRPTMPLNLGFLSPYTTGGSGEWLEDLVTVYEPNGSIGFIESLYEANLDNTKTWTYASGKSDLQVADGKLSLRVRENASEAWQYAAEPIDIDLSTHPTLSITVDSCESQWALKVCEAGQADVVLISDTSKTGTFSVDLSGKLGRENRFRGFVKLFEIGLGKTVVISRLDIQIVDRELEGAKTYDVVWTPSALEWTAEYASGLSLKGTDVFANEKTVLRKIEVQKEGSMVLAGCLNGPAEYDSASGCVVVNCGRYRYLLSMGTSQKPVFYDSLSEVLSDMNGSSSLRSDSRYVVWKFKSVKAGDSFTLACAAETDALSVSELRATALSALETGAQAALQSRDAQWKEYLRKVPVPENFRIRVVSSLSVRPELVRQYYYIAWIFLAQNILPPNPELDYPYAQVCCGKPSMWAYGAPEAAYSASWESFFGIQLLGYVMPDVAWSALEGLISLVDEDGLLGGESLPSEKAHTAWLLYTLTGDRDRLEALYPGIARYLNWRIENPRWIHLDHNDVNSADADFVASALIDLEYMKQIATALGKEADAKSWQTKHDDFLQMYYIWNFDESGNVYQYCNKITLSRTPGCTIWTTKGLLVDGLDQTHEKALLRRFKRDFDSSKTYGNLTGVKYPEISQAVLGLAKVGETLLAGQLCEICVRDMIRCGMFSENYTNDTVPAGTGVRPAMFGCAQLIDGVLMMNGFSYGRAAAFELPDEKGSVSNVTVHGQAVSFGQE
ncbi:MAG: hypothetical protein IJU20_04220 [Clostridia bacterium]|nr:hypothetical protein [Clostridia bacterium]